MDAIMGESLKSAAGGIGVENLKGSGLIDGESARAYNEVFTLSYVTGRSAGIGAYLNRLRQRVIQMVNGPTILTGFGALNELLGRRPHDLDRLRGIERAARQERVHIAGPARRPSGDGSVRSHP